MILLKNSDMRISLMEISRCGLETFIFVATVTERHKQRVPDSKLVVVSSICAGLIILSASSKSFLIIKSNGQINPLAIQRIVKHVFP